jgi:hypothetical protein
MWMVISTVKEYDSLVSRTLSQLLLSSSELVIVGC